MSSKAVLTGSAGLWHAVKRLGVFNALVEYLVHYLLGAVRAVRIERNGHLCSPSHAPVPLPDEATPADVPALQLLVEVAVSAEVRRPNLHRPKSRKARSHPNTALRAIDEAQPSGRACRAWHVYISGAYTDLQANSALSGELPTESFRRRATAGGQGAHLRARMVLAVGE